MDHLEKWRFPFSRSQRFLDPLVILAAVATAPIIVLQTSGHTSPAIVTIDWLIWAVFVIDFIVSVAAGKGLRFRLVLDTLIVVTSFPLLPDPLSATRLIRLTRLFRVIRIVAVLSRAVPALRATVGRTGFLYVAGLVLFVVIAGAGVMTIVEPETADFWEAIWWALVTTTTVGYGDIAPVTLLGRVIAVGLMVCGISLIASLSASIAAYFIEADSDGRQERIEMSLERLEARLERLEQALKAERANRK